MSFVTDLLFPDKDSRREFSEGDVDIIKDALDENTGTGKQKYATIGGMAYSMKITSFRLVDPPTAECKTGLQYVGGSAKLAPLTVPPANEEGDKYVLGACTKLIKAMSRSDAVKVGNDPMSFITSHFYVNKEKFLEREGNREKVAELAEVMKKHQRFKAFKYEDPTTTTTTPAAANSNYVVVKLVDQNSMIVEQHGKHIDKFLERLATSQGQQGQLIDTVQASNQLVERLYASAPVHRYGPDRPVSPMTATPRQIRFVVGGNEQRAPRKAATTAKKRPRSATAAAAPPRTPPEGGFPKVARTGKDCKDCVELWNKYETFCHRGHAKTG